MTVTTSAPMPQSGRRAVTLTGIEVRTADTGAVSVRGHAAVFDSPTMIGPPGVGFEEIIAPGAFRKTIADGADVRLLFNHNPDLVLARTKSGTLTLREDKRGLAVDAQLAPTSVGRDLAVLIQRGDVSQMSFGFRAVKDRWESVTRSDGSSVERRTVLEAQLFDVSSVTYPAYDDTDLAMREATLARELRDVRAAANPDSTEPAPATPEPAPEGGDEQDPEPAAATPAEEIEERSLPLHELLLRHASGAHAGSPRALCPACAQPAPATA
jgi:HK97 family phage prohead protease